MLAQRLDRADIAVAKRYLMVELRLDGLQRGQQAVGADFIEHLTDLVGLLSGLAEKAAFAELRGSIRFGAGEMR